MDELQHEFLCVVDVDPSVLSDGQIHACQTRLYD